MSSNKLPKQIDRIRVNHVYQLTNEVRVARGGGLDPVSLPPGHMVHVLWASKRWAECETIFSEIGAAPVNLKFRVPVQVLEDVT